MNLPIFSSAPGVDQGVTSRKPDVGVILLYELWQQRESHAPFTRAFTQMLAAACPDRRIIIHAGASHLQAAFGTPDTVLAARLTQTVTGEQPQTLLRTLRLLARDLWRWRGQRPLVIFLTVQPATILAVKLFRRVSPGFRCHLVLHGDVGKFCVYRSRSPIRRLTDFAGSLGHANHPDIRVLALERHIAATLATLIPGAAGSLDAIAHPCLPAPAAAEAWREEAAPSGRLRFGLAGVAGASKGLDVFARIARAVGADAAEFRLVGKLQPGWQALDLDAIAGPRPFAEEWLPRAAFERELAELHYLILPFAAAYYRLSPSGVLLDALRWRKPMIAFAMPVIAELTAQFGDIGHICHDEAEMLATVRRLLSDFSPDRYTAQRRNLDAAYRSRLPQAVAKEYAALLQAPWRMRSAAALAVQSAAGAER